MATLITVTTTIQADLATTWKCWTEPEHIVHWNFASDDWCCPNAVNDIRTGGSFSWRMEAKDGSFGFDYAGAYREVRLHERIIAVLGDGRSLDISFSSDGTNTTISETFEAEQQNSVELQQFGWQAILNNFKKHVES